ncbi:DUF6124 family protein [Pseudomonas sp. Xaverov 259]|uniref:DUF6124 family protein n=1 Tax=Pseudomonas sp. Xaverov 259 TaxID=2666086 RepID=UPI001C5AFAA8|nr:DUF6124 family protein [Pseudomonas sp. Xaverov 259]
MADTPLSRASPLPQLDGTEDLLVNLTENLASAHALTCDFAFDLEGTPLGIAQLIEVGRLLAERLLDDRAPSPATIVEG